jgi:hypothetical protein
MSNSANNGVWIVRDKLDDNTLIWKYMKYEHFKDLVKNQALYFNPITNLQTIPQPEGDPKEGVDTEMTARIKDHVGQKNLDVLRTTQVTYPPNFSWDDHIDETKAFEKQLDQGVYVNYFHINEDENMEMWDRSKNHNMAIKSTYGKLIASLRPRFYVGVNQVYYVDEGWIVNPFHGLDRYFVKRRKYEREQELRIACDQRFINKDLLEDPNYDRNHVSITLSTFLDQVVISPHTNFEFLNSVQDCLKKHNLSVDVVRSRFTPDY